MTTSLRDVARWLTVVGVAGGIAGCTWVADPTPTTTSPSTESTSSTPATSSGSAPPVTRPLDASGYADNVCGLLTDEQAAQFGVTAPATRPPGNPDVSCRRGDGSGPVLDFWLVLTYSPLDRLYEVRHTYPYFEPSEVLGQPAVIAPDSEQLKRVCRVTFDLAEQQGITILASEIEGGDGCRLAVAIAEQMVRNLGG